MKPDAPDIIRQTVRVFLDYRNAVFSVRLKDFGSMRSADIMPLQKEHDILDLSLIRPAFFDPLNTQFPDPADFHQFIRLLLNDPKGIFSKGADYPLCKAGADPLDQAGAEILFDPVNRCRESLFN